MPDCVGVAAHNDERDHLVQHLAETHGWGESWLRQQPVSYLLDLHHEDHTEPFDPDHDREHHGWENLA
jgi:hypothetical protein